MIKIYQVLILTVIVCLTAGCEKLLNEPSDRSLVVASSLEDLQAIIDRDDKSVAGYAGAGEESCDDYYVTTENYNSISYDYNRRLYIWADYDVFPPQGSVNAWGEAYKAIYACNYVLEELPSIPGANTDEGRSIQGQALFWRGFRYFDAAQIWTLPYDAATAGKDMGLPLRLHTDFNEKSVRSSVAETYAQIIQDLKASIRLLPVTVISPVRASRQAAYGALARVYMTMREYDQAATYADSCLQIQNSLINFNDLDPLLKFPIASRNNPEMVFMAYANVSLSRNTFGRIPDTLFNLYANEDLRKSIFYDTNPDGSRTFRGNYMGYSCVMTGVCVDEMLLVRAEGAARRGDTDACLDDLNTLLKSRWNKNLPFVPYVVSNKEDALTLVLEERRRELPMRGLRWMDIRRLNKEGYNITQTRTVNGSTYTLLPNDPRYALQLPQDILERTDLPPNLR